MSASSVLMPLAHLCLTITFFISGLVINLMQFILYMVINPISPVIFKKVNYYLHYSISSQILFVAEWWSGSNCRLIIKPEDLPYLGNEHALLIMNHTDEVDWLMGWIVADRCGVLGAAKVFVKDMLRYVPVIGWSWSFSNVVFLQRKWDQDKDHVNRQLDVLADYPDPVWMLIFCEGTRFTTAKHEASMAVARQKGLPELRHLLLPRTRGFSHSVSRLRHKFGAVYDITVAFDTKNYARPTLTNMMWGRRIEAELHVRRVPMSQLAERSDAELATFVHDAYQRKDSLLDCHRRTGRFWPSGQQGDGAVPTPLPRRLVSLLNTALWAWLVLTPILRYLLLLLVSGSSWQAACGCLIIVSMFLGYNKMIGLTKISHGSSYGGEKRD